MSPQIWHNITLVGVGGVTSYIWHSTDVVAEWPPFSALPSIWLAPFFQQKVYDWPDFSGFVSTTNSRTVHLVVVWWRQRPQDGGQRADGENTDKSAMDSLASSVGGPNQLTLTVSPKDPWLDDRRGRRRKNSMLAAGVTRKRRRYLYQIKGWWFVLFSFYCSLGVVARLSKCEITLCIGNTHVLKLFCFDRIFNSETYRPWPLCIWFDQAR